MSRLQLLGGSYKSRSAISAFQRCVNLYPEITPQEDGPPVPVTHMQTAGLTALLNLAGGNLRCLYRTSTGTVLFAVVGANVWAIDINYTTTLVGTITAGTTPVSMSDNGLVVVIVDGSAGGWVIPFVLPLVMTPIVDAAFYGSKRVVFLDGFFAFVRPNSNQFYLSPPFWNGVTALDPTYIASKVGGPDIIISLAVNKGNLWLLGQLTSEVWFNSGDADFPFERQPGVFIEHGMQQGWSVAEADQEVFFLGRDRQGQSIVFMGAEYQAVRVSNHALEQQLQSYAVVNDAVGFVYQQGGHTFYVLAFPTADKSWVFDLSTKQWHEWVWTDPATGLEHRHRANCVAAVFNQIHLGDWQNGKIYKLDPTVYTDNGDPIVRRRGFPHITSDGRRISYTSFIADMETLEGVPGGATPLVTLRWSDTRGQSFGGATAMPITTLAADGAAPSLLWRRLGMSRDRVFELTWSFPYRTSLNGAWIEYEKAET